MRDAVIRLGGLLLLIWAGFFLAGYSHMFMAWLESNLIGPIGWFLLGYGFNILLTDFGKKTRMVKHDSNKD